VTPVRTDALSIRVAYPTSTPGTSVIAFHRPGVPSKPMPNAQARGFSAGVAAWGPGVIFASVMVPAWHPGAAGSRAATF
jgi:hypothetical protein